MSAAQSMIVRDHAPATIKGPWHLRVSPRFIAAAVDLSDAEFRVFLTLEAHASENRPYCWPGLDTLGRSTGKSLRALQRAIDALKASGWIDRVYGIRGSLLGFVLLRRADPAAAAADTPERLEAARQALESRGNRRNERPRQGVKSDTLSMSDLTPSGMSDLTPSLLIEPSQVEPTQSIDRSTDRPELAEDRPEGPPAESPPGEPEAPDEDKARELQRRVYEGLPAAVAEAEWKQWAPLYRRVARDLRSGRLTEEQAASAVEIARLHTTKGRGARFVGAVSDFVEGRTPKEAARVHALCPAPAGPTSPPAEGKTLAEILTPARGTRERAAHDLVQLLEGAGFVFALEGDGPPRPAKKPGQADDLTDSELAELEEYRGEVRAYLKAREEQRKGARRAT